MSSTSFSGMLSLVFMSSDIISAMSITMSSTLQSSYLAGRTFGAVFEDLVRFEMHDWPTVLVVNDGLDSLDCRRLGLGDCGAGAAVIAVVVISEGSFIGRD